MAKEGSSGMRPKTIPGHLAPPQPRTKVLAPTNPSKGNQLMSYEFIADIYSVDDMCCIWTWRLYGRFRTGATLANL